MTEASVKHFDAPMTGRRISVNLHPTEFLWVYTPTSAEMLEVIAEHERLAIAQAWARWCEITEGTQHIWAFKPVPSGSGALRWLRGGPISALTGCPARGAGLASYVQSLSIDEQRKLFMSLMPTSRHALESVATEIGLSTFIGTVDLKAEFLASPSLDAFIRKMPSPLPHSALELLVMLRARGWLLFPATFASQLSNRKWEPLLNPVFGGAATSLAQEVGEHVGLKTSMVARFGWAAILMSDLTEVADMSREWMDEMEEQYRKWLLTSKAPGARGSARGGEPLGRALRAMWNHRFPNHQLAYKPNPQTKQVRKGDGTFRWLPETHPHLARWAEPLAAFVAQRPGTSPQQVVTHLNAFCGFLAAHPSAPTAPELVDRLAHINDVTLKNKATLMEHLGALKKDAKSKSLYLSYLREFFDWYPDWMRSQGRTDEAARFKNPISVQDRFKSGDGPGQSFRTALPSWLLKELRLTLTENDFAFLREGKRYQTSTVFDRESQKAVQVWWPGIGVLLLLLLELPLRSHQARWLDSGVLDDLQEDLKTHAVTKNDSEFAISGRRQACLRLMHDTLRQESWVGLFVNTNKTAVYDGKSPVGYEIPYLPQQVMEQLLRMREWGLRYLPPITAPLRYKEGADIRKSGMKVELAGSKNLPTIAPLFSDPRGADQREPVSYNKVSRTYIALLAETEKRVKEKYGIDIVLTELRTDHEGKPKVTWKYDMHTLRVSGISAMLENGVPLEVVSQFVAGHATLVMTLWYYKSSPGKIREIIAAHHDKAQAESDFAGTQEFADNVERFSPFLLSKQIAERAGGQDPAYEAMQAHTGLWTISSDGICPGTGCATGGEKDAAGLEHGPVPGGRRCGLCRYWITGPAFILGQVAEANNLVYQIRRKGQELAIQRDLLIEQTDSGQRSKARHTQHHIEALERELTIDLKEWQARYAYAMSSSNLLDDYIRARQQVTSGEHLPAPLLTASSAEELKLTLQEADEFVLLDHLTQMVDFLPGFKNREAIHEKHLILSRVLEENGLPQFLLKLDPTKAEVAANMMSSLILEYVKGQDLQQVLSGELKLADIPGLGPRVDELAQLAAEPAQAKPMARKWIPIKEA